MGFIGEILKILEPSKLNYHSLGILCIRELFFTKSKFKFSSIPPKQLESVICCPLVPNARKKRGLISYIFVNGIYTLQKHLEGNHW
jgi:hypothetical protein